MEEKVKGFVQWVLVGRKHEYGLRKRTYVGENGEGHGFTGTINEGKSREIGLERRECSKAPTLRLQPGIYQQHPLQGLFTPLLGGWMPVAVCVQ